VSFRLAFISSTILTLSINSVQISFSDDEYYSGSQVRYVGANENNDIPQDSDLFEISCSWSSKLADGILTYTLVETVTIDESTRVAVENAVDEWDSKIEGSELREVEKSPPASEEY
jgi:hypothetical protein